MSEEPEEVALNIPSKSSEDIRRENTWKSCCLLVDKRAVSFFSQLGISITIIVFCLCQLYTLPKCDSGEYMSLLTLVLGCWLPQPSMK
jgi:hypothetical protein